MTLQFVLVVILFYSVSTISPAAAATTLSPTVTVVTTSPTVGATTLPTTLSPTVTATTLNPTVTATAVTATTPPPTTSSPTSSSPTITTTYGPTITATTRSPTVTATTTSPTSLCPTSSTPTFTTSSSPTIAATSASPTPSPTTTSPTSSSPTLSPTKYPTIYPTVTFIPTVSHRPTTSPTTTCVPGSRGYCNHRGTCSAIGDGCECDDPLHYWPSEQCSTENFGPELEEGQCCKPGTVDAYCSWTGTCNFNGSWCECTSGHFWASERCAVYHDTPDPDPEPLYCPPLFPPSAAPTEFTSNAPTSSHPTLAPTFITTECIPGTRGYCHDKGTCSEAGDVCECDDPLHYWPSERCSIENPGPELEEGQCCKPGEEDAYCSWMGTCDSNGLWCNCYNPHFWSSERCAYWHDDTDPDPQPDECPPPLDFFPTVVPTSEPTFTWKPSNVPSASPTYFRDPCNPGSRGYCSNRGFCSETGECECDDPLHYWPSELCSTYHPGPELEDGQCCTPGKVGYYCSWIGRCHDNGEWCICPSGFWAEEGCSTWHNTSDPNPEPDLCPGATYPPSGQPSNQPSGEPTTLPSNEPSGQPSCYPTSKPSGVPTAVPSGQPTPVPTANPSHIPTTGPPTASPSSPPSSNPSNSPSSCPTSVPTTVPPTVAPTICIPGDRSACNNNGVCGLDSGGCECDDSEHYWPSEQCSTFHDGPELQPGQYCSPGDRNSYCSWLGVCSDDGLTCLCDDPEHRSSFDRCSTYEPPPPPSTGLCVSGDRAPCHNKGTCDSSTGENICTCDDPDHYWSSDFCSIMHFGSELADGDCCIPGERDYYCSWLGDCDASGEFCHCDTDHRWASERCEIWHSDSDPEPPSEGDDCPLMIFDDGPTTSSSDNEAVLGLSSSIFYALVFCVAGLLVLAAFVLHRRQEVNMEDRDSNFTYDDALGGGNGNFNSKSPYLATKAADTLNKVGLEKAGEYIRNKSFGYEGMDEHNGGIQMTSQVDEEFSKPSNFSYDDVSTKESMFEEKSPLEVAKEEEMQKLEHPSNFSYDDAVRDGSVQFSNENSLHVKKEAEKLGLLATEDQQCTLYNDDSYAI